MNHFHRIGLWAGTWTGLVLVFVIGCGKKPPVVLSLYCSESHFPVAGELAETFRLVYGVPVVCIPMDDATHPAFSSQEERESRKTGSAYETQKDEIFTSERIQQFRRWIENARYRNFGQYLLDHRLGDLYLCDSPAEVQNLKEGGAVHKERPLAYLTPVLMVCPEKGAFQSVEDVLKSSETLGIVQREVTGLGRETDRFLQNLRQKDPTLNTGRILVFGNERLLLQAWEANQIAAAICWDSTAERLFPQIEPIALPRTEILAVPLTMCDLTRGPDYQVMDFFSIFANSERGKTLFRQFGYKTR